MPIVADPDERRFVADRVAAWIAAPDRPGARPRTPSGVGSLGTITVTERDLPARRHLPSFRERFAERRDQLAASPDRTDIPIPLLTAAQLAALRRAVVVRTPSEFRQSLLWSSLLLLLPFYLAHAWLRLRRSTGDTQLLPIVHALCGIGFVMMVSLRDPVRDPMLFVRFAQGVAAGCLVLAAAASFDFERWLGRRLGYLALAGAVGLSLLLIAFGSGPGTSDAKVNLMGAQPVEAIRVLVMIFLAGHFAHRWRALRDRDRLVLLPVAVGMGLVLLFFFLQKDLGPALVLGGVFLGLYIVARGRARAAALGLLLLVFGFAGGYLAGYPHTVAQRVQMWWSPWDNAVRGGDQIANALWALGTGAVRGTGIGLGDPRLIPAGHTDLILSALGEETGLIGLLTVFALYVALAYRAFRIARRTPGDATFFLALGLTIGIFAQLLLIAAGLLDLMPLTGVTTPFLSYGRSSMLANFFAFGVLLAIGRPAGSGATRVEFARQTGWLRVALAAGLVIVAGRIVWVQTAGADHFVAATALAMQADGVRRFEYNPRLLAVAQQIVRGTVTDRRGIPLATSRPADLQAHAGELAELGVSPADACPQSGARCYPFGGLTFHLLGDWRSQVNWAAANTSFIERDLDARLRGYDDHRTRRRDHRPGDRRDLEGHPSRPGRAGAAPAPPARSERPGGEADPRSAARRAAGARHPAAAAGGRPAEGRRGAGRPAGGSGRRAVARGRPAGVGELPVAGRPSATGRAARRRHDGGRHGRRPPRPRALRAVPAGVEFRPGDRGGRLEERAGASEAGVHLRAVARPRRRQVAARLAGARPRHPLGPRAPRPPRHGARLDRRGATPISRNSDSASARPRSRRRPRCSRSP